MTKQILRVGSVQQVASNDYDVNLQNSIAGIRKAADSGAQLILLQELHTSRYFPQEQNVQYFDWAETIPGNTTQQLSSVAKELQLVIVASLFEKRAQGLYHNTAVVFESDGKIAGKYRKMHIPDDPGFHEKYYFAPGDLGFTPINTSVGKLGVLICWDQWFPEAARLMALAGAELLLYPTAIGWVAADDELERKQQYDAWITIQRAHAIANGLPIMVCNRTGFEDNDKTGGIQFWGSSFIAGAQGEILQQAPQDEATVLIADIDKQRNNIVRQQWPFLRDRRIDAYQALNKRYLV